MKVALVAGIHGARLVLSGVEAALAAAGVEHQVVEHHPAHESDWLCRQPDGAPAPRALASYDPTVVVACDYPYPPLRRWAPRAAIVGTRHSLAARGNTWVREQAEADWIVTWSRWDEDRFVAGKVAPKAGFLRAGCVFGPGADTDTDAARYREALGSPEKLVVWCPTWNPGYRRDREALAALSELRQRGVAVVARPHVATVWREPAFLTRIAAAGVRVDRCEAPLSVAVRAADVILVDVTGAGLWPILFSDGGPAVVHLDPPADSLRGSAQYDPTGPEWLFRDLMGPRVAPDGGPAGIVAALDAALERDAWREARLGVRATMLGPGPPSDPSQDLVRLLQGVC